MFYIINAYGNIMHRCGALRVAELLLEGYTYGHNSVYTIMEI
jgi:hypothetical protein